MRWLAATTVLAACYAPDPPSGAPCAAGNRCPSGLSCIDGLCVDQPGAPADAPPRDAPPGPPDAPLVCPSGYTRTSFGACHRAIDIPVAWLDAEHDCEQDGGHLVVVDSIAEALSLPDPSWTGATDRLVEGSFRAVTGAPIMFTYWDMGEPMGDFFDCAHVSSQHRWHAGPCDFPFPATCEYDGKRADPTAF